MRKLREERELTQTQAADRAKMTVSRWSDIETGRKANVTIETLGTIAAALGVDARELLTPKKKKG
jgi:transcriptional regulator with XRE-family HTH domain